MPGAFFFFQAEDGIRGLYVTGVQTCALPIWPTAYLGNNPSQAQIRAALQSAASAYGLPVNLLYAVARSEERRVGKECRSRWSADHEKERGGPRAGVG